MAVVAALISALFVSQYAPANYEKLEHYAGRLERNVADLRVTQAELNARAQLYQTNREAVAVEARTLGYLSPNQSMLRVDVPVRNRRESPGALLNPPPTARDRRGITRAVALAAFLISLALHLLSVQGPVAERSHQGSEMRRASR